MQSKVLECLTELLIFKFISRIMKVGFHVRVSDEILVWWPDSKLIVNPKGQFLQVNSV